MTVNRSADSRTRFSRFTGLTRFSHDEADGAAPSQRHRRVAYVLTQDRGGPVDVTVTLAAALAQRPGFDVRLFAPAPARGRDAVADLLCDTRVEGKGAAGAIRAARRQILDWNPDVVHAQDRRSGLVCARLGVLAGLVGQSRPIVVHTYHGVPDDVSQAWLDDRAAPGPSRYTRAVLAADAVVARSVARTVVVAAPMRDFLVERLHVPGGRVVHIDNGLALPEGVRPAAGPVRRLLFVGLLVERKGVDVLLRALARSARDTPGGPVRLTVVGDGPHRAGLEGLRDTLGLHDRVDFLGFRSDVAHLMAKHDAFVLPARMEQQPLVLIEAMAVGLPVVATDVGGVADMLGGRGRLVPPDDVDALAAAVTELVHSDGTDRARAAAELSRYAQARFSVDVCLEQHLDLYLELAEESNSPGPVA